MDPVTHHRPKVNEATLLVNGAVIVPRYVRESERPTSAGDCVTGPLIDNPEGWYVEYTYPGDTNAHRTFIAYDDVAGNLEPMIGDPRCPHPGGSRVNDGEWECSRCGHIFASYEAWAEATGNWAVTNAIAAELGLLKGD